MPSGRSINQVAHDNTTAKGRKRGNKNIRTMTVRYYVVIKR